MDTPKNHGILTAMMITTATPLSCSGGPGGSGDTVLIPSPCKSYVKFFMLNSPFLVDYLERCYFRTLISSSPIPLHFELSKALSEIYKVCTVGKIRSVAQLIAIIVQTNHIAGASLLVSSLSQLLVSFPQSWAHLAR